MIVYILKEYMPHPFVDLQFPISQFSVRLQDDALIWTAGYRKSHVYEKLQNG